MQRRGLCWVWRFAVSGLILAAAGCGSGGGNADPVLTPQNNGKDQPVIKPAVRGKPQSAASIDPSGEINKEKK